MEIRIGVQHVAREVVLESEQSPDEVQTLVEAALEKGTPLVLADERGPPRRRARQRPGLYRHRE